MHIPTEKIGAHTNWNVDDDAERRDVVPCQDCVLAKRRRESGHEQEHDDWPGGDQDANEA